MGNTGKLDEGSVAMSLRSNKQGRRSYGDGEGEREKEKEEMGYMQEDGRYADRRRGVRQGRRRKGRGKER